MMSNARQPRTGLEHSSIEMGKGVVVEAGAPFRGYAVATCFFF